MSFIFFRKKIQKKIMKNPRFKMSFIFFRKKNPEKKFLV